LIDSLRVHLIIGAWHHRHPCRRQPHQSRAWTQGTALIQMGLQSRF
jgi:hypothetical protein